MIWYHGTTQKAWDEIKREGLLWGRRYIIDEQGNVVKEVSRCTYLAADPEEAKQYGEVLLKVEYDPMSKNGMPKIWNNKPSNNYLLNCWQMRVYEPISLTNVTLL